MVGVAVKVTEVPVQIVVDEAEIVTDGVTDALTVIVTVLLVAVAGEAQAALLAIVTLTCAPFVSVDIEKVLLFVPAFTPLTCH